MSQNEMILEHMKKFGSITSADAYELYGCHRLGARIADLKAVGHAITSEMESGKNRFGQTVHYKRYRLED